MARKHEVLSPTLYVDRTSYTYIEPL